MTVVQYWLGWTIVVLFLILCVWRIDYRLGQILAALQR